MGSSSLESGEQYALYLEGRAPKSIELNLPKGIWNFRWVDTRTGKVIGADQVVGHPAKPTLVDCPEFDGEIALEITSKTNRLTTESIENKK